MASRDQRQYRGSPSPPSEKAMDEMLDRAGEQHIPRERESNIQPEVGGRLSSMSPERALQCAREHARFLDQF